MINREDASNCSELGWKEGDKFVANEGAPPFFRAGEALILCEDDGTYIPKFRSEISGKEWYLLLTNVEPRSGSEFPEVGDICTLLDDMSPDDPNGMDKWKKGDHLECLAIREADIGPVAVFWNIERRTASGLMRKYGDRQMYALPSEVQESEESTSKNLFG